jgi:antitoxin component of RelBE/YafQ-DinJ toxin-antitoxin module
MEISYSTAHLKRIGLHLVSLIRDRTAKGIDKDGLPFKSYSKNAFGMPYGATTKKAVKELVKQGKAIIFTSKNNKKWVLFKTGYLDYKKLLYKDTSYDGTVNLMLTGRMLGNLNVIRTENNQIIIGFSNTEMAERAKYNINRGRDFMGLAPNDLQDKRFKELLVEGLIIK